MDNAVGGYPSLLSAGPPVAEIYPGQEVWSSTDWSNHPRTGLGLNASGTLYMVTADGRTAMGDGMTTTAFGQLMSDLGAIDAIGLDGGGSTTMYIEDCWLNNIVNFPSDNQSADHFGSRIVSDGVYIK